jgi:hypothetical protein
VARIVICFANFLPLNVFVIDLVVKLWYLSVLPYIALDALRPHVPSLCEVSTFTLLADQEVGET